MSSNPFSQIGSNIDGEEALNRIGRSVSLSSDGSIVAIGASWNSDNFSIEDWGQVRIYQNINGTWTKVGDDINGEAESEESGYSVSLSSDGSIVAIGAPHNNENGYMRGHVRIYHNQNGTWEQIGDDIVGEAIGDYSGQSVSLSSDGSVVAIGATLNSNGATSIGNELWRGHVRIYQKENGMLQSKEERISNCG